MERFSLATLRVWTTRKRFKQALCFLFALAAHLAFFATISIANPYGTLGEGEGGLEVGLGLRTPYLPEPEAVEPARPQREFIQPIVEVQPPIPEVQPPETVLEEVHFQVQRPIVALEPIEIDRSWDTVTVEEPANRTPSSEVSFGSGTGNTYGGIQGKRSSYAALVLARLNKFKRYPPRARLDETEGEVVLLFVLEPSGKVQSARIQRSSGIELLDEAAMSMVHRAQPFPAFPNELSQDSLRFNIPVTFSIEED